MLPKLVITDIDGVWTDGGMYYDNEGTELKKFNTSDSAGVLFLRLLDIPVIIMTGENSMAVKRRGEKLKIKEVYLGVKDKLNLGKKICKNMCIELNEVAFIGDDINDLLLLKEVGISGAPQNAPKYIQKHVNIITKKEGGSGAFREFVEKILERNNLLEVAINKYFKELEFRQ